MHSFDEIELIGQLQQALADEAYETPTPVQAQTIPPALKGRDVLGCAQTGTGKTAAFALPILNRLGRQKRKASPNRPAALILAPTRELAIQIAASFQTYGQHLRLRQAVVYGGVNQFQQVKKLNRGVHLLVATPGRLLDLMNQGHIGLDKLEVFVLDESDRMLDMGFLPDLKRIIRQLPERRQSLFFSATLPPKIMDLSKSLLRNPVSVNVTPKSTSVASIVQRVMFVSNHGKHSLLQRILTTDNVDRGLVFTKTKRGADRLTKKLQQAGIDATAIHGNKSQNARQRALEAFRRRKVRVLVATDVAARGIDIDGITHVVNFDLPIEPECYVHRIGRTGRAGADGIALSFCSNNERRELREIEKYIGKKIPVDKSLSQVELPPDRHSRKSAPQRYQRTAKNRRQADKKPGAAPPVSRRAGSKSRRSRRSKAGS